MLKAPLYANTLRSVYNVYLQRNGTFKEVKVLTMDREHYWGRAREIGEHLIHALGALLVPGLDFIW